LEITANTKHEARNEDHTERIYNCTSEIDPSFFELPHHTQRLTGSILEFIIPRVYQEGEIMDIIVAMYVLVLFGVSHHGWTIAMRDEYILIYGGGPGPHVITSF
jgi:hypothetical protein